MCPSQKPWCRIVSYAACQSQFTQGASAEDDLLLSLMQETNNPRHAYQTHSHCRCKGEAFGISRRLYRLPENQRRPDGGRLGNGIHDYQSKCSFVDIVFENVVCPTTVFAKTG